jgi:hypothetical protein
MSDRREHGRKELLESKFRTFSFGLSETRSDTTDNKSKSYKDAVVTSKPLSLKASSPKTVPYGNRAEVDSCMPLSVSDSTPAGQNMLHGIERYRRTSYSKHKEPRDVRVDTVSKWKSHDIRDLERSMPPEDKKVLTSNTRYIRACQLSADTLGELIHRSVEMSLDLYSEMKMDIVSEDEASDVDYDLATDITSKESAANSSIAVSEQFEKAGNAGLDIGSAAGSDVANLEDLKSFMETVLDERHAAAWSEGAGSAEKTVIDSMTDVERRSFLKFSPASPKVGFYSNKSEGQKTSFIECMTFYKCPAGSDMQSTPYVPVGEWGNYKKYKLGPATWRIGNALEDYADDWEEVELSLEYNGAKMGSKGIIAALAHNVIRLTKSWYTLYFNATRSVILSEDVVSGKSDGEVKTYAQKYESIVFNYNNEPDKSKYTVVATYARGGTGTLTLYEIAHVKAPHPAKLAITLEPRLMVTGLPSKLVQRVGANISQGIKMQHKHGVPKFDVETVGFRKRGPAATPITIKTYSEPDNYNCLRLDKDQRWSSNSCWKTVLPQERYGSRERDRRYLATSIPVLLALMHATDSQPTEYSTSARFCGRYTIASNLPQSANSPQIVIKAMGHVENSSTAPCAHRGEKLRTLVGFCSSKFIDQVYAWGMLP